MCLRRLSARMIAVLLRGRHPAEQRRLLDARVEHVVVHLLDLGRRSGRRRSAGPARDRRARRPARCRPSRPSRRCRARRGCAAPRARSPWEDPGRPRIRRTPGRSRRSSRWRCTHRGCVLRGDPEHAEPLPPQRLEARRQVRPELRRRAAGPRRRLRSRDDSRRMSSNAPLMTSSGASPFLQARTETQRRSKSNGISSTFAEAGYVHLLVTQNRVVERALAGPTGSGC